MAITTVILCGGKGTRAYPASEALPKALMDVGGRPIVERLMQLYANYGFDDFVLAAGHRHEQIDVFVDALRQPWKVRVADTGEDADKGDRVRAVADWVGQTFFVTYADALSNIDLDALLAFHRRHRGAATMTTVPLPSPYGTVALDGNGRVSAFREKPSLPDHPINAGFFVFDRRVFEIWPAPGTDLEGHVLPALAEAGELFAYEHHGFWKSMDTYKDALELSALCADRTPPWETLS